jgi:hypothetical protein
MAWAKFPNLKRLVGEIEARPAVQRALALKDGFTFKAKLDEKARRTCSSTWLLELRAAVRLGRCHNQRREKNLRQLDSARQYLGPLLWDV